MSRSRPSEVSMISRMTSVTSRAATTDSTGSRPEFLLMYRLSRYSASRNAAGLSPSAAGVGGAASRSRPLRNHCTAAVLTGYGVRGAVTPLPGRVSAAGHLAAPGPLQVRLGALDLALQRVDRLG